MRYTDYLNSNTWKKKRTEVIDQKGECCQRCGSDKYINVHHASYKKKYREPIKHLFVLCNSCHSEFHTKYKTGRSMLNKTLNFIYGKGWRKKKENVILKGLYPQ